MDSVGIDITTKDIVLLLANIVLGVPVGLLLGWYVGRPVSYEVHRHVTSTARGREAPEGPQDHRDRSGTTSTGRHHALTGQAPGASTVSTDLSIPPASSTPSPSTEIRPPRAGPAGATGRPNGSATEARGQAPA